MSIITDGTTSVTFTGTQTDDFQDVEQSSTRTTGAELRTIRTGARFVTVEKVRTDGTILKELLSLLNNGANYYYYTPSIIPDHMESTDFPMSVNISPPKKNSQAGGGAKKYYYELRIEGVSYL